MTDFIFLDSKITVDVDGSHEVKTLAPWKKSYDKPRQHITETSLCPGFLLEVRDAVELVGHLGTPLVIKRVNFRLSIFYQN